jgi:hypothetical protein
MREGISWQRAVRVARETGWIEVNLYDMRPMTKAVKRAWKRKALVRVPSPNGRAVFRAAAVHPDGMGQQASEGGDDGR